MTKPTVLRRRGEPHAITFWHAEATICTNADGGGWFEEPVRCTHNHLEPKAADRCADAIGAAVERGHRPSYIVSIYEARPERFR